MSRFSKLHCALIGATTFALLLVAVGPTASQSGGCLFCGRTRFESWRCGVKFRDQVRETQWSAWVGGMHPNHTNHIWGTSSTTLSGWGFGPKTIGCGGIGDGGVAQIHYLRTQLGESRARALLDKYHDQLRVDRD